MYLTTTGLILREVPYKESSKILTVLTENEGKLTVSARGALRRNSKLAAATQLLVYSEMTLFSGREKWTLTEARSVNQFGGLRNNLVSLALGSYFAQLAEAVADEDAPGGMLLPLCLNSLYTLCDEIRSPEFVKPVFELRLMSISGFAPLITECAGCGREDPESAFIDIGGGVLVCGSCRNGHEKRIGSAALKAARYIISCDPKRIFSFSLAGGAIEELSAISEEFVCEHLDRKFSTLEYYNGLRQKPAAAGRG